MKKLFFILLLGNVIFYLWANNIQPKPETSRRAILDPSLGSITLLSEEEKKELAPSINGTKPAKAFKPEISESLRVEKGACFRTTILKNKETASIVKKVLSEHSVESEMVVNRVLVGRGFWVVFPAADDMRQAKANVRLLKSKGATNYWLFRKGEKKGAISLGMFKEKKSAEKAQNSWAKKGIKLEVKPHMVSEKQITLKIWSDIGQAQLQKIINDASKEEISLNREDKRCN
jgi:hypothetical protein